MSEWLTLTTQATIDVGEDAEKEDLFCIVVAMQAGAATLENSMEVPQKLKIELSGAPGWRSRLSVRLQPGHNLAVREFEPRVRLWADGSEPGACFRSCVSLSLCPSPVRALSLSVPKIKIKKIKNERKLLKLRRY